MNSLRYSAAVLGTAVFAVAVAPAHAMPPAELFSAGLSPDLALTRPISWDANTLTTPMNLAPKSGTAKTGESPGFPSYQPATSRTAPGSVEDGNPWLIWGIMLGSMFVMNTALAYDAFQEADKYSKNPWIASALNFLLPGTGYIYNGQRLPLGFGLTAGALGLTFVGISTMPK